MADRRRDVGQELFWREAPPRGERAERAGVLSTGRAAFYAQRRKIGERNGKQSTQTTPAIVPARIEGEPRREGTLVLELFGRRMLRLPESIPVERLVEALEARAPDDRRAA